MKTHEKSGKNDAGKKNKNNPVYPEKGINSSNPTPGSMSEGNQVNSGQGRDRSTTPNTKTFVTGTDDDGQSV